MASSRKPPSAEAARALRGIDLRGARVAVALSGGVDSVVLLHLLRGLAPRLGCRLSAVHVNHGLSRNAARWQQFCARLCRRWRIPLACRRVKVTARGQGLEGAAREARYKVLGSLKVDAVVLGHQLDDQAETVLLNLLRGAGLRGAGAMPLELRRRGMRYLRPLLAVPREAIVAYARAHALDWVDDESNAEDRLTRNFLRRRVAPLLAQRFPRWRESLARAARLAGTKDARDRTLLREYLAARGLRAPSEAKLVEMLRQLSGRGARIALEHDGARLRAYRGKLTVEPARTAPSFAGLTWDGKSKIPIPALGGELRLRGATGKGVDRERLREAPVTIRLRSGGERLRPDPRRPRRTLKNLFQEAGVPPWERARLPMMFCGEHLVWVPGLGVDAAWRARAGARGIVPQWHTQALVFSSIGR